jgi:hypothetical protein
MGITGTRPYRENFGVDKVAYQIQTISASEYALVYRTSKDDYGMLLCIENRFIPITMGMGIVDQRVIEFTIIGSRKFYIRNQDGVAREIFVPHDGSPCLYGDIHQRVIKVAFGKLFKHDGVSYVATDKLEKDINGNYVSALPIFENGAIDIIDTNVYTYPNGSGKIIKIVDGYTLTNDEELFYHGEKINGKFYDIGTFQQDGVVGLSVGKDGATDTFVRNQTHNFFSGAGVYNDFHQAYENYISNKQKPSCEWVGVGQTSTTATSDLLCITQLGSPNSIGKNGYLAIGYTTNEKHLYQLSGYTATQIKMNERDASGFDELYNVQQNDKFILFSPSYNSWLSSFEEQDGNVFPSKHIFVH